MRLLQPAIPLSRGQLIMMNVPDLLVSEIRENAFSNSVVENLVLLEDCFPLELRLDCECSSEVPLGTMVVPAMPELLKLLWRFPLDLSSRPVLWNKRGERHIHWDSWKIVERHPFLYWICPVSKLSMLVFGDIFLEKKKSV